MLVEPFSAKYLIIFRLHEEANKSSKSNLQTLPLGLSASALPPNKTKQQIEG
jgi:hypothetical protein